MGKASRRRAASWGNVRHNAGHHTALIGIRTLPTRVQVQTMLCLDCLPPRRRKVRARGPRGGYNSARYQRLNPNTVVLREGITRIG